MKYVEEMCSFQILIRSSSVLRHTQKKKQIKITTVILMYTLPTIRNHKLKIESHDTV